MNFVADIGNSQFKIAIERKDGVFKTKAFRLNDFVNIKKYLEALINETKPDLLYSSVLDTSYDKKLIKNFNSYLEK